MRRLVILWLALLGWSCGAPTNPRTPVVAPTVTTQPQYPLAAATEAEQRMFAAINEARRAGKLPPLVWNEQVALVARVSSARIRDFPGEPSLTEADYGDLTLAHEAKSTARASTIEDAFVAWQSVPLDNATVMSATVTQIGIGVVEASDKTLCATAIAFDVTPAIDTRLVASHLTSLLVSPHGPRLDMALERIARDVAMKLAAGAKRDDAWAAIRQELAENDRRFIRLRYTVAKLPELEPLAPDKVQAKLLEGQTATDVGLGVVQSAHPELGNGAVWVVVVFGEERPLNSKEPDGTDERIPASRDPHSH